MSNKKDSPCVISHRMNVDNKQNSFGDFLITHATGATNIKNIPKKNQLI